jgi:hypothetical protein
VKDLTNQTDNKNREFDFFNYVSVIRANDSFTDDPDDAITGDLRLAYGEYDKAVRDVSNTLAIKFMSRYNGNQQ